MGVGADYQAGRTYAKGRVGRVAVDVGVFHRVLPGAKKCALAITTRLLTVVNASARN